jgi:hypothetical protein
VFLAGLHGVFDVKEHGSLELGVFQTIGSSNISVR